ncbi:MAG: HD domain-containing protein [Coriobacteriia bacterium]|nr:HD domain-containing protein [Coriobacteriia bacterium]
MPEQHAIPYLRLDADVEDAIKLDRANDWHNPHAFQDSQVLRRVDLPNDRASITRPAFVRDTEKILHLPAYNHYADKTQVFSFAENDDISRRGLHVQLVSRIARNIGAILGLNTQLIEAIALGHDIGHTPFGHAGERFLSQLYHANTGRYFNHNVHSVRVLDQLYRRNMSLQTLDGALCHNGEFAQQKLLVGTTSTFEQLDQLTEACTRDEQVIATLRPSTLEGCVVRISDMVAYLGKDRSDAIDLGLLESFDVFESTVIGKDNSQIINNLTVDIINNSYRQDHIALSQEVFEDLKLAKAQNSAFIYHKEGMLDDTANVVEEMFGLLYDRLLQDVKSGDESSPLFTHHVERLCSKSNTLTKEEYLRTEPNLIVVDCISSMTDTYFMAVFNHFFPNSNLTVGVRTYL